jgi:hypothetical protein
MVRLCGASLGLFAFAVTIILGLAAGNLPEAILLRAIWAMFVFCMIGLGAGWVAWRVLDEHATRMHHELFHLDEKGDASDDTARATDPSSAPGQVSAAPAAK